MKKTTKTKTAKIGFFDKPITRKQFIIYCYTPMLLITFLLTGAGLLFREYYKANLEDPSIIRHYLVEAVTNLSDEAPLVPSNERQFIPEVKLSFPRDKAELAYHYEPKTNDSEEAVLVTSTSIKNGSSAQMYGFQNATDLLNAVPKFQHCQRILILTTTDKHPTYYIDYEKIETLNMGNRTVYVWKTTQELCAASDGTHYDDLLETVRSAQAY